MYGKRKSTFILEVNGWVQLHGIVAMLISVHVQAGTMVDNLRTKDYRPFLIGGSTVNQIWCFV